MILAFDTSAAHCAVALLDGDQVLIERIEPMQKGQAERLFPLFEEVLGEAQVTLDDLSAIGVCIGPGNFTGVRVGVSAARGLALSLAIPAIGVSRLEAMGLGSNGRRSVALDARRNKLYLHNFLEGSPIEEPELMDASDLNPNLAYIVEDADPNLDLFANREAPAFSLPVAVGLLASKRIGMENPRPAPLYLRQPDAALPSDPPPTILS